MHIKCLLMKILVLYQKDQIIKFKILVEFKKLHKNYLDKLENISNKL